MVGIATGFAIVELLNVVAGVQEKEVPPTALNVVEEPLQIIGLELLAATVNPLTNIVTVSVEEQPLISVPTTV